MVLTFVGFVWCVILLCNHFAFSKNIPFIETKIDKQLNELMSSTPSLTNYPVGLRDGIRINGSSASFYGKIWYHTHANDQNAYLVVYWSGSSNACQIDKLEVSGASSGTEQIWRRNTN